MFIVKYDILTRLFPTSTQQDLVIFVEVLIFKESECFDKSDISIQDY